MANGVENLFGRVKRVLVSTLLNLEVVALLRSDTVSKMNAAKEFLGPPKLKQVTRWRVEHINKAVDAHSLYDRRLNYTFDGID